MVPIQVIYVLAFLFYLLSVLIHILVLNKTIDFTLVNGGRSKDFEEQKKQSQTSIAVLMTFAMFVLSTFIFPNFRNTIIYLIIIILFTLFWLIGTVLQLLGTKFEKRVVLWINLVGVVSHLLFVLLYFE